MTQSHAYFQEKQNFCLNFIFTLRQETGNPYSPANLQNCFATYLMHYKMKPHRILVIGSSNMDMTVKADRLPSPGETVLGGTFAMGYGGKGANQAVAAKRLGGDVKFVCKVGHDSFGEMALKKYAVEGLDISDIMFSSFPTGVALITVNSEAENSIVVASGANADISVADIRALRPVIENASILLLQLEIPVDAVLEAASIAAGAGVQVILNPAPAAEIPEELFRHVSLIIPNRTELSVLTGRNVDDMDSVRSAVMELKTMGAKSVIVTLGAGGSCLSLEGSTEIETVPARKVSAVDTTAAGDTFCGALCVSLSEGKDIRTAMAFASAAASLTVTRMGAMDAIPFRSEADTLIF